MVVLLQQKTSLLDRAGVCLCGLSCSSDGFASSVGCYNSVFALGVGGGGFSPGAVPGRVVSLYPRWEGRYCRISR